MVVEKMKLKFFKNEDTTETRKCETGGIGYACDFQVWSLSASLPLCLGDSSELPGLRPPRLREVCPAAAASELCLLAAETLSLPWQSTLSCHLPVTSQG